MGEVQEITVPDIGDFSDVDVVEILVQAGDVVREGQTLVTLESDKATMEIPSPRAGLIQRVQVALGDKVSHGALLALLEESSSSPGSPEPAAPPEGPPRDEPESASSAPPPDPSPVPEPAVSASQLPYASPSVRALARELGVAIDQVAGTGDRGRITHDDVRGFVRQRIESPVRGEGAHAGALPPLLPRNEVDFAKFGPVERRALSRVRKIAGANLHRSWVTIPHVTNHDEADVTELEAFRAEINREHAKSGVKVTMLALLIKACVAALKRRPELNASLDGDQLVLKRYYHIGFAADTQSGLLVPVLRDADQKGILDIARETAALAAKARAGKLAPGDMAGGCFTISSLGGIGGTHFTPIINAPEVAILGAGKATTRLVWDGEKPTPRLILPLSLSWDHRVIDGAAAARFNADLAATLGELRRALL